MAQVVIEEYLRQIPAVRFAPQKHLWSFYDSESDLMSNDKAAMTNDKIQMSNEILMPKSEDSITLVGQSLDSTGHAKTPFDSAPFDLAPFENLRVYDRVSDRICDPSAPLRAGGRAGEIGKHEKRINCLFFFLASVLS